MTRNLLRRDLAEEITARVLDGRIAADSRINEVHLARELGVSRTPLREALIGLADRGLLVSAPNRGFLVPPFDPEEARQLYPLVAELESLALRWSSPQDLAGLTGGLDRIAGEMAEELGRQGDLSTLDDRWHALLVSRCTNPHLLRLLEQTKPLLKRYDARYFGGAERSRESIDEHHRIAEAIRAADLDAAVGLLGRNWVKTLAYLEDMG
ncbi:GntR family transcriptional regulator [Amycolatopsis keratiniphila]|uniref:GntR family transcriptional regulator n=1 Tax=Amycolatopsis keratiniphila TaxID=129921 RepID=R4T7N6_9PSEU|nr:GntR family transcriptional regulator [Amycolatopsis keratiniphila]AGM08371.1 GntR family transcriptional regulator [Amycolatopsis keratiniphila]